MKYLVPLILCWLLFSSVHYEPSSRGVFGVKVSIGANSELTTFACFVDNGRVLTNKRVVDKDTFIKIASGFWPSPYNPARRNLFEENKLDCSVFTDSITLEKFTSCVPLDSLWKIRFATYPFRGNSERGWSNKLHKPSSRQEIYLYNRYGVSQIDGQFFLDTSFWLLLRDVRDTSWIKNYKSLE